MAYQYEFEAQTIIDEGRTNREAIDEIKNWLPTTNFPKIPDELIVLFLLSCQNAIPATQNTIKAYFRIKRDIPEMFRNRDVDSEGLNKALRVACAISIPRRLDNNVVIHLFKLFDTNYQNFDWTVSARLVFMVLYISQRNNPPNELIVIIDMKGIGFMHLTRLRIGLLLKFFEFLQDAMPLKLKMIHVLNSNFVFDKMLLLGRVVINRKLLSLIKTHSPNLDMALFFREWIPASHLPKDYGGDLPSIEELNQISFQQFRELKPFFEAEEKFMYED